VSTCRRPRLKSKGGPAFPPRSTACPALRPPP
jgi:hypothetical protein